MELVLDGVALKWGTQRIFYDTYRVGVNAITGSNGGGKTSLLRILAGVARPQTGRILFNGKNIDTMNESYREIIGYLPQNFGVYRNYSARKFLRYISRLKGLENDYAAKKTEECLKLVNLIEYADIKLNEFSGGMKQRIGIAQTLLNDPQILIMDEPTAGLDIAERINFRNMISEFGESKIIIFSTHILSDLNYITDRVIELK